MPIHSAKKLVIRELGQQKYEECWQSMKRFTHNREALQTDELWVVEHPPVFTLGVAGKKEHLLNTLHNIPVVNSDRGGQITYHGPGQLILYPLLNIQQHGLNIKQLVNKLEHLVMRTLNGYNITANTKNNAPGVYVNEKKIASIGLRVRKGCCYHGISLNVDMDLTPFSYINPCGYENLTMCQIKDWLPKITLNQVKNKIIGDFIVEFGYTSHILEKTTP